MRWRASGRQRSQGTEPGAAPAGGRGGGGWGVLTHGAMCCGQEKAAKGRGPPPGWWIVGAVGRGCLCSRHALTRRRCKGWGLQMQRRWRPRRVASPAMPSSCRRTTGGGSTRRCSSTHVWQNRQATETHTTRWKQCSATLQQQRPPPVPKLRLWYPRRAAPGPAARPHLDLCSGQPQGPQRREVLCHLGRHAAVGGHVHVGGGREGAGRWHRGVALEPG